MRGDDGARKRLRRVDWAESGESDISCEATRENGDRRRVTHLAKCFS